MFLLITLLATVTLVINLEDHHCGLKLEHQLTALVCARKPHARSECNVAGGLLI